MGGRGTAAARAPLRAGGRERRVPRGVRPDPDRAARRGRRARPTTTRGARHPSDRRATSAGSGRRGTPASAPRPSATSATASARRGAARGRCALTLGSDSHAVVDPFEEMRAVSSTSGWPPGSAGMVRAPSCCGRDVDGHRSLGFGDAGPDRGRGRADLVTVDLTTLRTAGAGATRDRGLRRHGRRRHQVVAGGWSSTAARPRRRPRADLRLGRDRVTSVLVTGIGELVTNDPQRHAARRSSRRRAGRRGRGSPGSAAPRGAPRPTRSSTSAAGR